MPRPKKAKVDHLELKRSESAATSPATTATEEASPSGSQELDLGTREASVSEESKVLRKKVNDLVRKARAAVAQAAVDRRKAEAELRHEERRKEERMKRWEAAERRPEPPPAYLQLERLYKSQVKGLKAQLKLSPRRAGGMPRCSWRCTTHWISSGSSNCPALQRDMHV